MSVIVFPAHRMLVKCPNEVISITMFFGCRDLIARQNIMVKLQKQRKVRLLQNVCKNIITYALCPTNQIFISYHQFYSLTVFA